ncbi:MAG: ABC transporter permease [Candidatus Binatia bacterium]
MDFSLTKQIPSYLRRLEAWSRVDPWTAASGVVALTVALPLLVVFSSLATPRFDIWTHLWQTQLTELIWNTIKLMLGVGVGVLVLGTGLAWIVTRYRFPGQAIFEWLLILPLAMPSYVIGFVFLAIFDYTGPIQSWLRTNLEFPVWFPEIKSLGGLILVMSLVLYPYVYMLARTAFLEQTAATMEAARCLGGGPATVFWRVAFPLARPSIIAGTSFALMEALADFGTVAIYGYPTFTVAIYRIWFGMFDRPAATQVASLLMLFTFLLYLLEHTGRGRARFYQTQGTVRPYLPRRLLGWRALVVNGILSLVIGIAFVLPVVQLVIWVLSRADYDYRYREFLLNTLVLGITTALLAVSAAVVVAYGLRLSRSRSVAAFADIASMGYALPGSVIAVGVLSPLVFIDHTLDTFLQKTVGISSGLLLTGSMVGLVFAYLVRFLAVSFRTVEASLVKITPNMDMAGRSLGVGAGRVLWTIHVPLIRRGLITALILVFVDVMKEMPATLLLRPFGYDTLAVRVWQFTSESLWDAAALPALTIVAAGILPVLVLVKGHTRLGQR